MLSILVIVIYLSFVLDLVVWPISSEASTAALWRNDRNRNPIDTVVITGLSILSLAFLLLLVILVVVTWDPSTRLGTTEAFGISVSILGRMMSLLGTWMLRRQGRKAIVQKGIFRFTRNPISVGIHLTVLGIVISLQEWYLWVGLVLFLLNMHKKILIEERHLLMQFGADYEAYVKSTPRYLVI